MMPRVKQERRGSERGSHPLLVYINPRQSRQRCFLLHHLINSQTHNQKPLQTIKPPNQILTMESAKQAANYVAETVQGAVSGVSKETNKEVAKDSNAPIGTR